MSPRNLVLSATACLSFVTLASADAPSFTPLGIPTGNTSSVACAVSDDGSVVVGSASDGNARSAFRWTETTGFTGLGTLGANPPQTWARAVSSDGSVVVGSSEYTRFYPEAFRWTQSGGMVRMGFLPNAGARASSHAEGVSDDGSVIVGTAYKPGADQAFRWTQATGMVGLGFLPDAMYSAATAISSDGSVVVGYSGGDTTTGRQAFRWTEADGMVSLENVPGGQFYYSDASAISPDGSVVVGSGDSTHGAFRWTQETGMVALGRLSPDDPTYAYGVSADGGVIVGSNLGNLAGDIAFIWDEAHGVRNLKDVLVSDFGLDLAGWTLCVASGITPDAQTIVGYGIDPSGVDQAWVVHLPEPGTVSLLALGGLLVLAPRRR